MGIADHGTFSGAAEALGTVQSNISTRVARLEAELGTALVDRSTGSLTDSGRVVVERARRMLAEREAIAADVSEMTATLRGQVALGMIGTAGRWIVPLLLAAQRATYPRVQLRIVEGSNSTLVPQVVHGQLDLAVLAWPVDEPELTVTELFAEDLVLVVPVGHELAGPGPVTLRTLSRYDLLLPLTGTPIRREIDQAASAHGVELSARLEMDGLRTIASLTFDGLGIAILPASMLSARLRDQFVAVPIEGVQRRRAVLVGRRFGFPSAPTRAIGALLIDVVAGASDVPAGVHVGATARR